MTPEEERELRNWTIERVLSQYANRDAERVIKRLLDEFGSPRAAFENMPSHDSFYLGNFGCVSHEIWLDARGGAKSGKIEVWKRPGGPLPDEMEQARSRQRPIGLVFINQKDPRNEG